MEDRFPLSVLLGYEMNSEQKIFYLDTLAVIIEGKGIGKLMMKHLIQWARYQHYKGIRLDTEAINIHGVPMVIFYERFGFKKIEEDARGDITLELLL